MVFCDLQSSHSHFKHCLHILGLPPAVAPTQCHGGVTSPLSQVLEREKSRASPWGKQHLPSVFLRTPPVGISCWKTTGNSHTHGGSPCKTSGMQGHSLQHRVGCLDPPSPISSCCPWEGGNAEQKAHDEPSKHRLISSPVTRVARVGRDPSLMLRASTRYAVGVQQALPGSW